MGDWEKIRYRNVKRNYEALMTIGNQKCWVLRSLGNMNQAFSPYISLPLGWLCLITVPFCMKTNLE